jgi:hypothetical protein
VDPGGQAGVAAERAQPRGDLDAFACYADEHDSGEHDPFGVMVFALPGDKIAGILASPRTPSRSSSSARCSCSPRDGSI